MAVDAIVGGGIALDTVLLQPRFAGAATAARIHHATDTYPVAFAILSHPVTDRSNPTDDLVPRHHRVLRETPVILGKMDVGVAHAAVVDLDGNIVRAQIATVELYRLQGALAVWAAKAFVLIFNTSRSEWGLDERLHSGGVQGARAIAIPAAFLPISPETWLQSHPEGFEYA